MNWPASRSEGRRCQFCDSHVTSDFARTFGDANNVAHRCLKCDTFGRVAGGSAAGRDVSRPDPQTTRGHPVDLDVPVPVTDGGDEADE